MLLELSKGSKKPYLFTLRGSRMYDFFQRLIDLAIPREKDFRGLSENLLMVKEITIWA